MGLLRRRCFRLRRSKEGPQNGPAELPALPLVVECPPAQQRDRHRYGISTHADAVAWANNRRRRRRPSMTDETIRHVFTSDPIVLHARLAFFFRDLAWNASAPTVDGVKRAIHDGLRDNVPNIPAVVRVGDWAHLFTAIDKEGRAVTLRVWAWGDDEDMAMGHLHSTFDAIHGCLRWISDGIKSRAAKP